MQINNPLTYGISNPPDDRETQSPYDLFSLFFTDEVLDSLAESANQNAQWPLGLRTPRQQFTWVWEPTTGKELRAYIGADIWMGIYRSSRVDDFLNRDPPTDPFHKAFVQCCSALVCSKLELTMTVDIELTCSREPFEDLRHPIKSCNHAIKIVFVIANLTVMHPGLRPPSQMLQLPSLDHFLLVPEINPKLTYSI